MEPIPIDCILSISSEEQKNKAINILNVSNPNKTWRCKSGTKQASVILQFKKPSIISSINVGNNNSAFIEINVGTSTTDEFRVLLVTSSLMTLHECKNGLNVNKVHFFDTSQLSPACQEPWDRVKIVCSQPFIQSAKFGLSFIEFQSYDFFTADQLFPIRHRNKEVERITNAVNLLIVQKDNLKMEECKNTGSKDSNSDTSLKIPKAPKNSVKPIKIDLFVNKNDLTRSPAIQANVGKKEESASSSTDLSASMTKLKLIENPIPITKPFSELLNNVIFTMSGYQNPYRNNLRSKALEMGAKYNTKWDQSCTHFICDIKNSPKCIEAKKHGAYRIVKSNWIDICYGHRCQYPWRRFALDKLEQNKPESEDEIFEHVNSSAEDSDDEWIDVSTEQLFLDFEPVSSTPTSQTNDSSDQLCFIYDTDFDINSDSNIPDDN